MTYTCEGQQLNGYTHGNVSALLYSVRARNTCWSFGHFLTIFLSNLLLLGHNTSKPSAMEMQNDQSTPYF